MLTNICRPTQASLSSFWSRRPYTSEHWRRALCGSVRVWVDGDQKCPMTRLFSIMLTSKMCWFQIWCQKLSTAFLSKVMSTLNFQIRKFKVDYPYGKRLKKLIDRKGVSAPRKASEVFKKNPIEKKWFQVEKYQKYSKSKNDVKRPLGPFYNELWAI